MPPPGTPRNPTFLQTAKAAGEPPAPFAKMYTNIIGHWIHRGHNLAGFAVPPGGSSGKVVKRRVRQLWRARALYREELRVELAPEEAFPSVGRVLAELRGIAAAAAAGVVPAEEDFLFETADALAWRYPASAAMAVIRGDDGRERVLGPAYQDPRPLGKSAGEFGSILAALAPLGVLPPLVYERATPVLPAFVPPRGTHARMPDLRAIIRDRLATPRGREAMVAHVEKTIRLVERTFGGKSNFGSRRVGRDLAAPATWRYLVRSVRILWGRDCRIVPSRADRTALREHLVAMPFRNEYGKVVPHNEQVFFKVHVAQFNEILDALRVASWSRHLIRLAFSGREDAAPLKLFADVWHQQAVMRLDEGIYEVGANPQAMRRIAWPLPEFPADWPMNDDDALVRAALDFAREERERMWVAVLQLHALDP